MRAPRKAGCSGGRTKCLQWSLAPVRLVARLAAMVDAVVDPLEPAESRHRRPMALDPELAEPAGHERLPAGVERVRLDPGGNSVLVVFEVVRLLDNRDVSNTRGVERAGEADFGPVDVEAPLAVRGSEVPSNIPPRI